MRVPGAEGKRPMEDSIQSLNCNAEEDCHSDRRESLP